MNYQRIAEIIGGWTLWSVSAALSIILFLSLAGEIISQQIIMAILAGGFEIAKITLWRRGGLNRLLSLLFIFLSLTASFFGSLQIIEQYRNKSLQEAQMIADRAESSQFVKTQLTNQITTLSARLSEMPGDWPTRASQISHEINQLRQELIDLQTSSTISEQPAEEKTEGSIFIFAAEISGIPEQRIVAFLLILIAILTEAGAVTLLSGNDSVEAEEKIGSGTSGAQEIFSFPRQEIQAYFAALTSNGAQIPSDRVLPRDSAAEIAGISSHQAKKIISALHQSGVIRQRGRLYFLAISKIDAMRFFTSNNWDPNEYLSAANSGGTRSGTKHEIQTVS
jgi:hypothetical protein